jgi:hypothetical protein
MQRNGEIGDEVVVENLGRPRSARENSRHLHRFIELIYDGKDRNFRIAGNFRRTVPWTEKVRTNSKT